MKKFLVQKRRNQKSKTGGAVLEWVDVTEVCGYLDMLDGSVHNPIQNALVQSSSHVLVVPEYQTGIEMGMRIVFEGKLYQITYVDNPVNLDHHLEIYCKYDGKVGGVD
ncbi:phage head closure protein [Aerococcaceae bacterium NML191219]|nr:phage head closure protein [Aerococcaceae bacterium NML191219]